jgi:mannose-6-phosphate isomerase-like protein (cupin superfamily)
MNSIKVFSAGFVLFFGLLATTTQNPSNRKALTIRPMTGLATAASEEASRISSSRSSGQDGPGDSSHVAYFSSQQVRSSFTKPGNGFNVLYDGKSQGMTFDFRTDRRDGPGTANVHALFTEIYIVEEGTATYVSGGSVIDPKTTEPNEIRGSAIQSGETHYLSKGDVIVVPKGVPHWFKDAKGPFLYYLVRIQ